MPSLAKNLSTSPAGSLANWVPTWTKRDPAFPTTETIWDVTWGNGLYVLVGLTHDEYIQTSPDGVVWTSRTVPPTKVGHTLVGANYINNLFFAVGQNEDVHSSSDGINWVHHPTGETAESFYSIDYSTGLYVLASTTGKTKWTTDLISFNLVKPDPATSDWYYEVRFIPWLGLWILVGDNGSIFSAPDGKTWTRRTPAGGYTGNIYTLNFSDSLIIVAGQNGGIQSSVDGVNWVQQTAAGGYTGAFTGSAFTRNTFILGGTGAQIQFSYDGVNWYQSTPAGSFSGNFAGAGSNGRVVLVGTLGEIQTGE